MAVVDWRDRFGRNHVTSIRDQGGSQSCWAFAVTGLIESMVRIEHNIWCCRSEGDLGRATGKQPWDIGNAGEAATAAERFGLADPDCIPWSENFVLYLARPHGADMKALPISPTPDRAGRTVRVAPGQFSTVASIADKKQWLTNVGPMAVQVILPIDFSAAPAAGIFTTALGGNGGSHYMLVVGFDDAQSCWIVKNSWGTGFAANGFVRVAYGQGWLENPGWVGMRNTNPDPHCKRRHRNGAIVESGNGAMYQNRELFLRTSASANTLDHLWQEAGSGPWYTAGTIRSSDQWRPLAIDAADIPAVVQSTFNRNYELVFRTTSGGLRHFYFDQAFGWWFDVGTFGPTDAIGIPGFAQGNRGAPGDFEVVVATAAGALQHWTKHNSAPWTRPPGEWRLRGNVASAGITAGGPALVVRRIGVTTAAEDGVGELHVVAAAGNLLKHFTSPAGGGPWTARSQFGGGPYSGPCMIESVNDRGDELSVGNLELFVEHNGEVEHWQQEPPTAGQPTPNWKRISVFGKDTRRVIGAVQSSQRMLEVYCEQTSSQIVRYVSPVPVTPNSWGGAETVR